MPRPKPHYRVLVTNLETKERLRVELIDLPFLPPGAASACG
jgi:hypothetical protein